MKKSQYPILLGFVFLALCLGAQEKSGFQLTEPLSDPKTRYIQQQDYLSKSSLKEHVSSYGDSLIGFDEQSLRTELLGIGLSGAEFHNHIDFMRRRYIQTKYHLVTPLPVSTSVSTLTKKIGGINSTHAAPCVNEGFELTAPGSYTTSNAVTGWTISSAINTGACSTDSFVLGSPEFSVLSTPVLGVPFIGNLSSSPFGGTKIAQINNFISNYSITKIAHTFPVTATNPLFQFAFAGVYQDGGQNHTCCSTPGFTVIVKDCNGVIFPCNIFDLNLNFSFCGNSNLSYTYTTASHTVYPYSTGGVYYTDWQVRTLDLTALIGTCATIEAITRDCPYGGHFGTTFFDTQCSSSILPNWCNTCTTFTPVNTVNYCSGSNIATITGPLGFSSYTWTSPGSGTTITGTSSLSISNPVLSSVYTLQTTNGTGCTNTYYYTIALTSVAIVAIDSSPTCSLGTQGSATVQATGSGTGYLYTWTNATNSVVSTSSVASNLGIGVYTVIVTANPAVGCGTSMAAVTVGIKTPTVIGTIQTFCGNTAYLSAPAGVNHQWYSGTTPISAANGGTASTYVVSNASANAIYHVTYLNQGCMDSLKIELFQISQGSISILNNSNICEGQSNGLATVSITPSFNAPSGLNSYTVVSANTLTPTYSFVAGPAISNTLNLSGLNSFGTYSVTVFDGSCIYSANFVKSTFPNTQFTINPASSVTLCPGNVLSAGVTFSISFYSPLHTYSWSPTTFLANSNDTLQQTVITPTFSPGAVSTIIYSIVVTPTAINCPVTKTLSVTMASPLTPTISSIPLLCSNSSPYTLTVNPPGGLFSGNNSVNTLNGVISPSVSALGLNTFSYAISIGTCVAESSSSFVVNFPPYIGVFGNTLICNGQTSTLQANGPATYSWNSMSNSPVISVSPSITTLYTAVGFDASTTCSSAKTITLTVIPIPTVVISGANQSCAGTPIVLTASGANTYYWSTGHSGSVNTVSPLNSGTISVSGTSALGNCSSSSSVAVTIYPIPVLSITPQTKACFGQNMTLVAWGANTFSWTNGPASASMIIAPSTNTQYTVTGTNTLGNCSSTKTISVIVIECTGVESLSSVFTGLSIFPNPTSGNLNLEIPSNLEFQMYDDLGKLIFEKQFEKGTHSVDMSRYSSGIYLLKISDARAQKVVKVLKTD